MKKILVIEDEPQMRRNVCTILRMEGFMALAAADGAEGITLAKSELPDLVLCDVMMPNIDGYGVLANLRQDPATSGIPFIFLTARGEKADLRAGMNLGADDYLTKPVPAAELLASIAMRLRRQEERVTALRDQIDFVANFADARPLEQLGLTPREAEVLLWVAQGKANSDIGTILTMSEGTVKKHLEHIFAKLGVESRSAATVRAIETLSAPKDRESKSPSW